MIGALSFMPPPKPKRLRISSSGANMPKKAGWNREPGSNPHVAVWPVQTGDFRQLHWARSNGEELALIAHEMEERARRGLVPCAVETHYGAWLVTFGTGATL